MRKFLILAALTFFVGKGFCQELASRVITNNDLLIKERSRDKTTGWILLGAGLGIAAAGGLLQLAHENQSKGTFNFDFTGTYIAIGGGVVALASIPFFIRAGKNGRNLSEITFSSQPILIKEQNSLNLKSVHGLSLRVDF